MLIFNQTLLVIVFIVSCTLHAQDYAIRLITDKQEQVTYVTQMAELFVDEFRNYPYLYQGQIAHAVEYYQRYISWPHTAFAIAIEEERLIAFLSGTSLVDYGKYLPDSIPLFLDNNLLPKNYYYFGEMIVLSQYRNQGLSKKLYELVESHAISLGYKAGCYLTKSHETHPLKPSNYYELDAIFSKLDYNKTSMSVIFEWETIQVDGSIKQQEHTLTFWLKTFAS